MQELPAGLQTRRQDASANQNAGKRLQPGPSGGKDSPRPTENRGQRCIDGGLEFAVAIQHEISLKKAH